MDNKQELIELVSNMIRESGSGSDFSVENWVESWIVLPNPALGFKTPTEFLENSKKEAVIQILKQIQSGAYA